MKRSNSNSRYSNQQSQRQSEMKYQQSKNKTISTVIQTENDHQQQTTKKNSLHKVPSSRKLVTNINTANKNGDHTHPENRKTTAEANFEENLITKNKQLTGENKILREEFCKLQEIHILDKTKIQTLISRMSQMKSQAPMTEKESQNSTHRECQSKSCIEKRKRLEVELHRERIKVYELEQNKKKWEASREHLKEQYKSLFEEIQVLKEMN